MLYILVSRLVGALPRSFPEIYATIMLCAVGALEFRGYLDRADVPHLTLIMPSMAILAAHLAVATIERPAAFLSSRLQRRRRYVLPWAVVGLFALANLTFINPLDSVRKIYHITRVPRYSDQNVVPPAMWQIAGAMKQELSNQRCMYSLTTSPIWYYLFDVPSCSSFYYAPFARTSATQKEIIGDLKRAQPRIIIARDAMESPIDDIPVPVSCPGVWKYIQQAYEPYRTIDGVEFYRLRSSPLR
jgi:hypothetical protein